MRGPAFFVSIWEGVIPFLRPELAERKYLQAVPPFAGECLVGFHILMGLGRIPSY